MINPIITELWLPLTNEVVPNIQPHYLISNFGRVYSKYTNKILTPTLTKEGYLTVTLRSTLNSGNRYLLHRLVMKTFNPIPNSDELEVNHKNGIKT